MAHMRYLIWAETAQREGFPNVGRLFRVIAFAEQLHATGHIRAMGDVAGDHIVAAGEAPELGAVQVRRFCLVCGARNTAFRASE